MPSKHKKGHAVNPTRHKESQLVTNLQSTRRIRLFWDIWQVDW